MASRSLPSRTRLACPCHGRSRWGGGRSDALLFPPRCSVSARFRRSGRLRPGVAAAPVPGPWLRLPAAAATAIPGFVCSAAPPPSPPPAPASPPVAGAAGRAHGQAGGVVFSQRGRGGVAGLVRGVVGAAKFGAPERALAFGRAARAASLALLERPWRRGSRASCCCRFLGGERSARAG